MRPPFPTRAVTVTEVQRYFDTYGLDCSLDSRQLLEAVETAFGVRIRIATLILAALWNGFAVAPRNHGKSFVFSKIET